MALARETVRLGLGARGKAKIKVRQPLAEAVVVADGREREAIERLADVVREELNVRRVRFVAAAEELSSYEVKANYRTLGPLFGKDMPLAADAIAALDPAQGGGRGARRRRRRRRRDGDGGEIGITVAGREHTLSADDVILTMRAPEGYSVEREGAHAVALDLDDRRGPARGGLCARDRPRRPERAQDRRSAGRGSDRAEPSTATPRSIRAADAHRDYLAGETLAVELLLGDERGRSRRAVDYSEQTDIEGLPLRIALRRAAERILRPSAIGAQAAVRAGSSSCSSFFFG